MSYRHHFRDLKRLELYYLPPASTFMLAKYFNLSSFRTIDQSFKMKDSIINGNKFTSFSVAHKHQNPTIIYYTIKHGWANFSD